MTQEIAITEEKYLITIEQNKILDMFTKPDKLETLILNLKSQVLSMANDVNTPEGRQEIISLGYNIARTKTYIDSIGKDLVTEYKEVPKKIDAIRKKARDLLDDLKDEVKKPLDLWKEEQEKIAHQLDIFNKWDEAHTMNQTFIEAKRQQAQRVEMERLQREEDIRRQAIIQAETQAKIDLEKQQKQHEREIALKELEKMAAINAEKQRAKEEAIKLEQAAIKLEQAKIAEENRIKQIEIARQNNAQHKKNIQEESIMSLILNIDIDSAIATQIVEAIDQNLIDNIMIKY
jgi:colicin import membrane protein